MRYNRYKERRGVQVCLYNLILKTETAPAVRKRRFLLYQQLCLHSGGCGPDRIHHQCIPHHFHQGGPHMGNVVPVCVWIITIPILAYGICAVNRKRDKRCRGALLPGIRPRQHRPHPDRHTLLRYRHGALLPWRILEIQPRSHQRPRPGGRRQRTLLEIKVRLPLGMEGIRIDAGADIVQFHLGCIADVHAVDLDGSEQQQE